MEYGGRAGARAANQPRALLYACFVEVYGRQQKVDGARDRNRTGTAVRPRDFKSLVSTNFTTRAGVMQGIGGGACRSRTDLHGFAIRCITALLTRHLGQVPA